MDACSLRRILLVLVLVPTIAGCTGDPATSGGASASSTSTSGTAASTDGMSSTTAGTSTSTTMTTTTTTTSSTTTTTSSTTVAESDSNPTCAFLCRPDCGADKCGLECDVWLQDCPQGEKCVPYAENDGSTWNSLHCVPAVLDPVGPGEPCTVVDYPTSGVDDCAKGSMCFFVDPDTLMGECVALCVGTPDMPGCADPKDHCISPSEGVLNLCLPVCDPLLQDCDPGESCIPEIDRFGCVVDQSGDAGAYGDPCTQDPECDPGNACIVQQWLPGCASTFCCAPFCDLQDPGTCPDALPCTPWYGGQAPPGYEDVGVCASP